MYNLYINITGCTMDKQTPEKNDLILTIKSLYKEINKISNTYLQYDEINVSQRSILEALLESSLTVPKIAKRHGVSRQHIQTNVNNLIKKGFVVSVDNEAHKRSNLISITQRGQTLFEEIMTFEKGLLSDLFTDIKNSDISTTKDVLSNMHVKAQAISEAIK